MKKHNEVEPVEVCSDHYDCRECHASKTYDLELARAEAHAAGRREGLEAAAKRLENVHGPEGKWDCAEEIRKLMEESK